MDLVRKLRYSDTTVGNICEVLDSRVYINAPAWNPPALCNRRQKEIANRLGAALGRPLDKDGVANALKKFPPRKQEMYTQALDETLDIRADSKIKAFCKWEGIQLKPEKRYKPRIIQFRRPRFLAHMLRWYKPIEHAIYRAAYLFHPKQRYCVAKGFNPHERMELIEEMVSELDCPVNLSVDGSAWDAHIVQEALELEWTMYIKAARRAGWPAEVIKEMRQYKNAQKRNRGTSICRDGKVKYTVSGNRMSGDLNTGSGNTILNCLYLTTVMRHLGVPWEHFRIFVDGDDAIVLCSKRYCPDAAVFQREMRNFSQETKIESQSLVDGDSLEPIEFCQARPVKISGVWRLVRNPRKVINCYLSSKRWFTTRKLARRYFSTIAAPEMIINSGVPILHTFFALCVRSGEGKKPLLSVARGYWRRQVYTSNLVDQVSEEVDEASRRSFEKAFGISPVQQWSLEQEYSSIPDLTLGIEDLG